MEVSEAERQIIIDRLKIETERFESGQPGSLRAFNRIVEVALLTGFNIDEIGRDNVIQLLTLTRKEYTPSQKQKQWILLELGFAHSFANRAVLPDEEISRRRVIKKWHDELLSKDNGKLNRIEIQCKNWDFETCYQRILKWNRDGRIA